MVTDDAEKNGMKSKDFIDFWFKETKPKQWFEKNAAFDRGGNWD